MFPLQLFPVQLFPSGLFDRPKHIINITQTLILADLAGQANEVLRIDVLTFIQSLISSLVLEETFTDTLFFTQSIVVVGPGPVPTVNVANLTDHLFFTQSVITAGLIGLLSGPYNNEIFPNQVFSYHIFPRALFVTGTSVTPTYFKDRLNFTELFNGINPTTNEINLPQTLFLQDYFLTQHGRYVYQSHDELQFEQEVTYTTLPQFFENLQDKLLFDENVIIHTVLNRSFLNTLLFNQNQIQRNIDGTTITVPGLIGTITNRKARYVKLQSKNSVIILPSPLFGDTQTNVAEIKINRAVNGTIYTLVKKTQRQRINYKFEIKRQKSNELQLFFDNNDLEWINIVNWRGEMYFCKLVNNPIVYEAISRDGICRNNNERHTVELEFEGYLINSQLNYCD